MHSSKENNSVIVGAGTHGQVYASYLKEAGISILGFIDDNPDLSGKKINNIPVIGTYKELFTQEFKKNIQNVYCPIGDNKIRVNYLKALQKEGYATPNFIHHTAHVAPDVTLGNPVYILAGTTVMPHAVLKNYVMVNMNCNIAHHVTFEDGVFLSSGVNMGALVHVQENVFAGIGATVMTGVREIGKNTIIGAGAVVIDNLDENITVVGNPARILSKK